VALAAVVIVALTGLGSRYVWHVIRCHSHFTLASVDVVGSEHVAAAQVYEWLDVPSDASTWDVDLERLRRRLLQHPWVASARVRRELPDRVVVTVRERRAVSALAAGDDLYAIDRRGRLIGSIDAHASYHLPRITGASLPGVDELPWQARHRLREVAKLVRVLTRFRRLAEVRVDGDDGVTVQMAALPALPVHFGWGDWKAKRRRLARVLALWSGREDELESVELAFGRDVVVRLRSGLVRKQPRV
jgi:cell division protein FtsQ